MKVYGMDYPLRRIRTRSGLRAWVCKLWDDGRYCVLQSPDLPSMGRLLTEFVDRAVARGNMGRPPNGTHRVFPVSRST